MTILSPHQIEAIKMMKNGCILCGDVGTGKSRTALAYYYMVECGGSLNVNGTGAFKFMTRPRDLYIITTAKKRDSYEWEAECGHFCLSTRTGANDGNVKVTIDSWNNIKKYKDVYGAFFIFDEQRVVGFGAWTKSFLNIARKNHWILLSATPGDTWTDYIPVFIANGFYRNKTEFNERHCVFSRFSKYPKIERFINVGELEQHRRDIMVRMLYVRQTTSNHIMIPVMYDQALYRTVMRNRWDPYENEPIKENGKLCYLLRKVVNTDVSRQMAMEELLLQHPRVIVFYNYSYELEIFRGICDKHKITAGEWNGEMHTDVPTGERWAYLVQYAAGCEGWNCIETDTIVFYSQSYSYRMTKQAEGRIDRLNTPYKNLYYYKMRSTAPIDLAISRALSQKKNFNEKSFVTERISAN